jgi:hypothetical protein
MSDCIDHARRYRSHIIEWEEIRTMWNGMIENGGANGAVVFVLAGPQEPEFALVTNYGDTDANGDTFEFDVKDDVNIMLRYADPVGIVMFYKPKNNKDQSVSREEFRTFKGKEWAQKYEARVIEQGNNSIPIYRLV